MNDTSAAQSKCQQASYFLDHRNYTVDPTHLPEETVIYLHTEQHTLNSGLDNKKTLRKV